uniref:Uncharacterized protein n=1 Tax=Glossina pallidipes TaxID=7398 RepID=A0A1A9ZD85_GLOPL
MPQHLYCEGFCPFSGAGLKCNSSTFYINNRKIMFAAEISKQITYTCAQMHMCYMVSTHYAFSDTSISADEDVNSIQSWERIVEQRYFNVILGATDIFCKNISVKSDDEFDDFIVEIVKRKMGSIVMMISSIFSTVVGTMLFVFSRFACITIFSTPVIIICRFNLSSHGTIQ